MSVPGVNQIDKAAFAAENAAVTKQIENLPKCTPVPADVQQLLYDLASAGVPVAAAHILARRIAGGPSYGMSLHVQRLEGRVIELERELEALGRPAHMASVERR